MGKALLCLFALLFPMGLGIQGYAAEVSLLSADADGVTLGLQTGPYQLEDAGNGYQRVRLTGFEADAAPGNPQLPRQGTLLAVPAGSHVVVDTVDGAYDTLTGLHIAPVPTVTRSLGQNGEVISTQMLESATYGQDRLFPASPASLGFSGSMRGQGVAQILLYPVQVNPVTGEVRIYSFMQVRVRFVPDAKAKAGRQTRPEPRRDDGYRAIMQHTLINFGATP